MNHPRNIKISKLNILPELQDCNNLDFFRGCVENGRLEEEGQSLLHFLATIGHVGLMNILLLWMTVRGILSNYINRQWHRPLGIPVVVEGSELTENRYVSILAIMDRTTFLGLKEGQVIDTRILQDIQAFSYNAVGNVQKLLQSIGLPTVPDTTPLACAVLKGHKDLVQLLMNNGASVNTTDAYGNTPAMLAAATGQLDILHLLEEREASLQGINYQQKSIYTIARENHHYSVSNYCFYEFSRLRTNIKEWNSGCLSRTIASLQTPPGDGPVQGYYLECGLFLKEELAQFLRENFAQDMNLTSVPRVDPQQALREFRPMAPTGGSYSCSTQVFLHHLLTVHNWILDEMAAEHASGVDMEERIFSILCMMTDDVDTFITSVRE